MCSAASPNFKLGICHSRWQLYDTHVVRHNTCIVARTSELRVDPVGNDIYSFPSTAEYTGYSCLPTVILVFFTPATLRVGMRNTHANLTKHFSEARYTDVSQRRAHFAETTPFASLDLVTNFIPVAWMDVCQCAEQQHRWASHSG